MTNLGRWLAFRARFQTRLLGIVHRDGALGNLSEILVQERGGKEGRGVPGKEGGVGKRGNWGVGK